VIERLSDNVFKISEGTKQHPGMNIVEVLWWHNPVIVTGIVNEEMNIFWHRIWLDWGEIGSLNFCTGKFVANFYCPLTRSSSNIEYSLWVLEGGKVVAALECALENLKLKI